MEEQKYIHFDGLTDKQTYGGGGGWTYIHMDGWTD